MTNPVPQFLDELADAQDLLGKALVHVESRLNGARLSRLAPIPKGDTGFRGIIAPRSPEIPPVLLPEILVVPTNLGLELTKSEKPVAASSEAGTGTDQDRSKPVGSTANDSFPMADEKAQGPDSLVRTDTLVGNRWEIALVAWARIRVSVEAGSGNWSFLPDVDSSGVDSYEVEFSVHRVVNLHGENEEGFQVAPFLDAVVAKGRPYRVLAWNAFVRDTLNSRYKFPQKFVDEPVNNETPLGSGLVRAGERIVVVALDLHSAESEVIASDLHSAEFDGIASALHSAESGYIGVTNTENEPTSEDAPDNTSLRLARAWSEYRKERGKDATAEGFVQNVEQLGIISNAGQLSIARILDFLSNEMLSEGVVTDKKEVPLRDSVLLAGQFNWRLHFDEKTLRRKFKHAADFGICERYSKDALMRFEECLESYVSSASERYLVSWRGRRLVAHVGAGRIVWTSKSGAFVTGYRATSSQLKNVWAQREWIQP
jgi:Colicin D